MPIPAFSTAWADALVAAVNADAVYRDAAKGWTNVVALVVEPDETIGAGAAVEVDLDAGTCLSASALTPDAVSAPFVLSGALAAWKQVVGGTGDPMLAVATGALKLTRGSLTTLMMHSRSAKALLVCARQIDTLWP
ncbi:MAG: SCP2 sterol-binding domain-containing protein [Gemmatimonadaceae bacterium]|nr:SCP2 sterol-binding domain-containing protein [Gemmatimonadaceae bacterium]